MRPETGPMKFGDDWRGVFIRGDSAMGYAMQLRRILNEPDPEKQLIAFEVLRGLVLLLESAVEGPFQKFMQAPVSDDGVQMMLPFDNCKMNGAKT